MTKLINQFKLINDISEEKEKLTQILIPNHKNEDNINFTKKHIEVVLAKDNLIEILTNTVILESKPITNSIKNISKEITFIKNVKAIMLKFTINPNHQVMDLIRAVAFLETILQQNILIVFSTDTNVDLTMEYVQISAVIVYKLA